MSGSRTVFVIDDDPVVRRALIFLLSTEGLVGQGFSSAQDFLEAHETLSHGCVVVDLRMPGMDGLDLQRELARRRSLLPVIVITGHGTVPEAIAALKGGAFEFLEKPLKDDVFLDCVRRALDWDAATQARAAEIADYQARAASLTARETDVMRLVIEGHQNKNIAHQLSISLRTVEIHRGRVMEKMGARTASELVRIMLTLDAAAAPETEGADTARSH